MAKHPSDLADKFMLRMPDGMRDRISAAAKVNGRSMNSEIVARLELSLERDDEHESALTDHERRIEKLEGDVADLLSTTGLRRSYDD